MVRTKEGESERNEAKMGLHQRSVLTLLRLFVTEGLPWELLNTDDLVLMAESNKIEGKLNEVENSNGK